METFLTKLSESISQQTESEKKSELNNQLQEVKKAAEKLKNQLESKNQQTIKPETNEFIQKLMETFLTLDSKLSESISQQTELEKELQDEKNRNEKEEAKLKTQIIKYETDEFIKKLTLTLLKLDSMMEFTNKSEINNHHQQVKKAAEKLKNQLESKSLETIKPETNEFIQKLMETFPTLDSKSEKKSEIMKKLQQVKKAAEKLKNQLESKNQQLEKELQHEKNRNEKEEAKLKTQTIKPEKTEFIQKLMETFLTKLSESISQQTELQSEKKSELNNQLQQVKEAAEKLKNQLESKNQQMIKSEMDEFIQKLMETFLTLDSKLCETIRQAQEEKQKMERLNNELYSTKQQLENKLKDEEKRNEETKEKVKELQSEKITEIIKQLNRLKQTTATLKDWLEENSHKMFKSEMDEIIQKDMETFLTKREWTLEEVKATAELLKTELENKSQEMINSEKEKDEIIKKLMETFPTLDSKWKKNTDIIKQLMQVKQRAEGLKKQLEPQTHESEEETETIRQLQQLEQAAEILKIQLESKNQQMIKSERQKNEIIQNLMKIFPTLDSKWKENTDIIHQLQEVKETAEKLKQLEKKNLELQGETDSDIIKQLQRVKDKAENLKHQMESINWQMLWTEKTRNDETEETLKELVKQLEEKKKKTEETLNELEKSSKEEEDMENGVKAPVGYKGQRRSQPTGDDEERTARGSGGFPSQHLHTTDTTQGRASNDGQVGPLPPNQQQMNKRQKGDFILKEVNGSDNYICLRNSSSEDKMMTDWKLKLQNKDGKLFTYKFQESFTLKPGEGLTLHRFNTTRGPYPDNIHLKWADMPSWCSRDKVTISLISNTKEEHQLM